MTSLRMTQQQLTQVRDLRSTLRIYFFAQECLIFGAFYFPPPAFKCPQFRVAMAVAKEHFEPMAQEMSAFKEEHEKKIKDLRAEGEAAQHAGDAATVKRVEDLLEDGLFEFNLMEKVILDEMGETVDLVKGAYAEGLRNNFPKHLRAK